MAGTYMEIPLMKPLQLRGAVKIAVLLLCLPLTVQWAAAQTPATQETATQTTVTQKTATKITAAEQELISLSKQKWQWMANKKLDALTALFHDDSSFVHMSRTLSKTEELEVIKTGNIHYKRADIHEVSVKIIGNTAILLNKITLLAVVRGNEVTNPFVVTEVYVLENDEWKLASMSFTRLVTP
jgi:hypothetical protein